MTDAAAGDLDEAAVAAAARIAIDDVRRWAAAGLLDGSGDRHPPLDVERCRLIAYAEGRGLTTEDILLAAKTQGDVVGYFTDLIVGTAARFGRPPDDVALEVGLDPGTLDRIWAASGLGDQDDAYPEDVQALAWIVFARAAGIPDDALIQLVRVYADALGRVAEAEDRMFHYYVHERLLREGLTGQELVSATSAVSQQVMALVEPAILYFHHKAFQRALRDDMVLHLTEATAAPGESVGRADATILFVDLSGFTTMTETLGDDAAARAVDRFSDLVRQRAGKAGGRIVKQIGDEFMLAFHDPTPAVRFAIDVNWMVAADDELVAVRIGAHHGPLLHREGDYIGSTVNLAARIAGVAGANQIVVTKTLADAVTDDSISFEAIGARSLKGISGEVHLLEVATRR
jgi:adenylate cyclase